MVIALNTGCAAVCNDCSTEMSAPITYSHWHTDNMLSESALTTYNNAFMILHNLPMRRSASFVLATAALDSCNTGIRKCIYSLMSRLSISNNLIVQCTLNSDVYTTSCLHSSWVHR